MAAPFEASDLYGVGCRYGVAGLIDAVVKCTAESAIIRFFQLDWLTNCKIKKAPIEPIKT